MTIADTCVDLLVDMGAVLPRFGQTEQWVQDYFLEMGGSACIFACQAAKLGLRTGIIGRVGDDPFGQLVRRRLEEAGVDTAGLLVDANLRTGLGVALCCADGDRSILTHGGSLNAVYPEDLSDAVLSQARHLHYCSYYLQTNLQPAIPDILARARRLGLSVSLDTNWDPEGRWDGGLQSVLSLCDLFLPNEQEARAIAREADLDAALAVLLERAGVVAIKRGERGSLVGRGAERVAAPVASVASIVDTVGAGDSYDAGFVAGWLKGLTLAQCAAIGNACGRASTQARGGYLGQLWARDISELAG
ncbi:MAG: carbohydrate kinase family protein [Thiobacillaceae bacterium]